MLHLSFSCKDFGLRCQALDWNSWGVDTCSSAIPPAERGRSRNQMLGLVTWYTTVGKFTRSHLLDPKHFWGHTQSLLLCCRVWGWGCVCVCVIIILNFFYFLISVDWAPSWIMLQWAMVELACSPCTHGVNHSKTLRGLTELWSRWPAATLIIDHVSSWWVVLNWSVAR